MRPHLPIRLSPTGSLVQGLCERPAAIAADPQRWWALALLAVAQLVTVMDTSIVGVALPDIKAALDFSQEDLSWVFNAYVIAYGGLLLLTGRLTDVLGARRVLSTGFVVLIVGSTLAGLAESTGAEIAGRAIQGVAAALIAPAALALVVQLFAHDPHEMTRALALFGASAPLGGTAGVFFGGVLTATIDWRWTLLINVPLAIAVLVVMPHLLPETSRLPMRVPLLAGVLITAALALVAFGIVGGNSAGWSSAQTIAPLTVALALAVGYALSERRSSNPLIPRRLLRRPNVAAIAVTMALLGGAWVSMWYFLNLYLQQALGLEPFDAGLALIPLTVLITAVMVGLNARVINRLGPRPPLVAGLVLLTAGLAVLATMPSEAGYLSGALWGGLLAAAGMSLSYVPALNAGLGSVPTQEAGLATGVFGTAYQVGVVLSLAALTAIAGIDPNADASSRSAGFDRAFGGAALIAAAALAAATLIPARYSSRSPRSRWRAHFP